MSWGDMDEEGHPISRLKGAVMSDGAIGLCLMVTVMTGVY